MPEIKFQHIISFSSEDKVHKAENLLRSDTFRKWKCATPGEKQACVVIKLEKCSLIHSIDIGNESSAFVEILVGRSVDQTQDFKVLLVTSSFMSPMESKNGNNINRVRMFGPDKLSLPTSGEKWDLVKIVCTQPFNKSIQYGLSFIKLHSPPNPIINDNTPIKKLGSFSIKENEDNDLNIGSWFAKRKENQSCVSSAVAIREASSLAAVVLEQSEKLSKCLTSPNTKLFAKQNYDKLNDKSEKKEKLALNKNEIAQSSNKNTVSDKMTPTRKRKDDNAKLNIKDSVPKKPKNSPKVKPFNKLMENVVFVLSGFKNPYRAELRDKAVKMGARYKGDWDKSCTHLICAFINTPKYIQVRKVDGRIVTKEWILDCYSKRSLLPWRDYMLGKYQKDSTTDESETESDLKLQQINVTKKHCEHTVMQNNASDTTVNSEGGSVLGTVEKNTSKDLPEAYLDYVKSDDEYAASTDIDESNSSDSDSGRDTEEELRKAQCTIEASKKSPHKIECCRPDTTELPLPELPEFFKNKCFYLYGSFTSEEIHNLERYIIAFHGFVSCYMDEKVNFVVTKETWDDRFNDALEENDQLIFVKPQWIYECKENSKLIPYQRFVVVPAS